MRTAALLLLPFVALAATTFLPTTLAAVRITSVEVLDDPVAPDTGIATVAVTGEVDCASVLLRQPPGTTVGAALEMNWTGEDMTLAGALERRIPFEACAGRTVVEVSSNATVAMPLSVPALEPRNGTVTWRLTPGPLDATDPASASAPFSVRTRPEVVAAFDVPEVQGHARDGNASWQVAARNLGNTPILGSWTARMDVDGITYPEASVRLEPPKLAIGAEATFEVVAQAPPGTWRRALVAVELEYASALEPRDEPAGVSLQLLMLNPDAASQESPAPPLAGAGLAVALAFALAAGRRRGPAQGS